MFAPQHNLVQCAYGIEKCLVFYWTEGLHYKTPSGMVVTWVMCSFRHTYRPRDVVMLRIRVQNTQRLMTIELAKKDGCSALPADL